MSDLQSIVSDPRENIIATLGNTTLQSFLTTGVIGKMSLMLTDKRVYFKGKIRSGMIFGTKYMGEEIVDLKDITGTGFKKINPLGYILLSILSFIFGIIFLALEGDSSSMKNVGIVIRIIAITFGIIWIISYIIQRRTIFYINYAGGTVCVDLRLVSYNEIVEFNRTLRICKDNITNYVQPAIPYHPVH